MPKLRGPAALLAAAALLALAGCGGSHATASPARATANRACATELGGLGIADLQDLTPAGLARLRVVAGALDKAAGSLTATAPATAASMRATARSAHAFLRGDRTGSPDARGEWNRLAAAFRTLDQVAADAHLPQCRIASRQ